MRKKQMILCLVSLMCAMVFGSTFALAGQTVKIPYVVSDDSGWWTGLAITNHSSSAITDMKLYFTTDTGASSNLESPPVMKTAILDPDPMIILPIYYNTALPEIAGNAILTNTLTGLYTGEGSKTLPSNAGSVVLTHSGNQEFSVTVYIGGPTGFAFQVFNSELPTL
ncbi:MAG: hypothetical protein JXR80_04940 [Deltaproteobacteria bacterium]|nr:hypothetical protein [Deltaproteobacteria bacterium]